MSVVGLQSPNRLPFSVFLNSVMIEPGSWMLLTASLFRPVSTMVPPLPVALKESVMISSVTMPAVMMVLSAPLPLVSDCASSMASAAEATAWVAPSSMAFSRLFSSGSTAMRFLAPAKRAPCTALMPIPPTPTTITVSPGFTAAAFTAEPQPVGTPQPTSTALSSGRSSSTLTTEFWWMVAYWLKVPSMHMAP